MGRYQQREAIAEVCAMVDDADERRTDRELEAAHKRLNRPSYDDLLRLVIALELDRDTWKDGYMELSKLMNVPEC